MEERPQYRAYNQGFDTLTNVDLISLVINRGAGTKDSQEQARQIYNIMGNSLRNIGKARIEDLEVKHRPRQQPGTLQLSSPNDRLQ